MAPVVAVYVEAGPKRTFAAALDWPGWARSGRDEADALAALAAYAPRYARAVRGAPATPGDLEVVERLKGNATTDFGVPGAIPTSDARPLSAEEMRRQMAILKAAWRGFDRAAQAAEGVTLTTGPRGGGRTLPKIRQHVLDAEAGYAIKLGTRYREAPEDAKALRAAVARALTAIGKGEEPPNPSAVKTRWPPRYFVRRAAWHLLDHAWELEDRSS